MDRLQRFIEAARSLSLPLERQELLRTILSAAMEVMEAGASSVFISDPATRELVMVMPMGSHANKLSETRIPQDKGIAGAVFSSLQTIRVDDTRNDPRFFSEVDKKSGFVTRALLCAPLLHQGECVGVLQVLNPEGRETFTNDDERYFEGFASLVGTALVRIRAQEQESSQRRLQQELQIASEIQNSFLPRRFPPAACVRVESLYDPANEISGDFYCVREFEDSRFLIVVGDVSGKGIPAALTMARVTAEIRALPEPGHDLGVWVTLLNRQVSRDLVGGRFIAITALVFDPAHKTVGVCCAGQPPPLRYGIEGWVSAGVESQLPIGVLPYTVYTAQQYAIQTGERWMIFSDGVPDARNDQGEEFGLDRLLDLPFGDSAASAVAAFKQCYEAFVGQTKQHDDVTLIIADWRGAPPPKEWLLPALPSQLKTVREHIERWAIFAGFDDITIGQIVLAVDEASANVIRYAYADGQGPIHYKVELDDDSFCVIMTDNGTPVDTSKVCGRKLEEVRPGGLGTHFMSLAFPDIEYCPQEKGTILRMKRPLPNTSLP